MTRKEAEEFSELIYSWAERRELGRLRRYDFIRFGNPDKKSAQPNLTQG